MRIARLIAGGLAVGVLGVPAPAPALPPGPMSFCQTYAEAPVCASAEPPCSFCHRGAPPERNPFGMAVESALLPQNPRPLNEQDFAIGLAAALRTVEALDSDGDGATNLAEIEAGTFPGDASSTPAPKVACDGSESNPSYDVCGYDVRYVMRKISLDFCGRSPTWDELEAVLEAPDPKAALHVALDRCLDTEFWMGPDGQLWELAHPKIRPIQAIKAGANSGEIPLADYDHDYWLFVYTQIDGHDARDVLLADYFVQRTESDGQSRYRVVQSLGDFLSIQRIPRSRRAGLLTTRWNLVNNTMFTALPRLTAAQAMRSFLGLDIAKLEGLRPVAGEPKDWDGKDVGQAACAVCHSTLDPLSYPFKNYEGLAGNIPFDTGTYRANRMERSFRHEAPTITQMPESGVIFGQPVENLTQWAEVAANSDAFASATVMDYWRLLLGETPRADEQAIFQDLWARFQTEHQFSVEAMLHDLIDTEAYGVP